MFLWHIVSVVSLHFYLMNAYDAPQHEQPGWLSSRTPFETTENRFVKVKDEGYIPRMVFIHKGTVVMLFFDTTVTKSVSDKCNRRIAKECYCKYL